MTPTVVFDSYWRFAAERLAIFYRRYTDPVGPWTSDPVLRSYRFTNTFRAADRVSQYLIREVQARPDRPQTGRELFFRTMLFKIFNRIVDWITSDRTQLINVTDRINEIVRKSGVRDGIVHLQSLHTTTAVFINEWQDALLHDVKSFLEELIRRVAETDSDELPETILAMVESRLARVEPRGQLRRLQSQHVRPHRPGDLLRLGIIARRQPASVQRELNLGNPAQMERVPGPGVHPRPVVNRHGGTSRPDYIRLAPVSPV